jgi:dolichyl-diphosphooligosaccharide--protein glycosyltransferase
MKEQNMTQLLHFEFHRRHVLIIIVLAIAFTTAFIMRSYPIKYGFYLNEYDPYFNYRATKYIVDNGLDAYWKWHDTMSWYPEGRDVARTSQSGLHVITAFLYYMFDRGSGSLLNFTIMLPVVLGSLTTIIVFALVRVMGGSTSAGMFAALLFAFSPAIIQRGNLGWFKSEPLGLFLGLTAVYLFLSAIKYANNNNNKKMKYLIIILKSVAGGIILGFGNVTWNGVQYFIIPISLFLIALPFVRKKEIQNSMYVVVIFTLLTIIVTAIFPRTGISFVLSLPSIALVGATVFVVIANFIKKHSKSTVQKRNILFVLIAFILLAIGLIAGGLYYLPDKKYLVAVNPFMSYHPIVESVAENSSPTIIHYLLIFSTLFIFAGIGTWFVLKYKGDEMPIFALIIGITGIYVSIESLRLLVFASIGIIILAAIGLLHLISHIIVETNKRSSLPPPTTTIPTAAYKKEEKTRTNKKQRKFDEGTRRRTITNTMCFMLIVFLLLLPMLYPRDLNWISYANIPPTIASGATTNDWLNALNWISKNSPKNSVIAAWWDYGYWITTLANRTTLADNAANNQTRIVTIAKMLMDKPEDGIKSALNLKADYILIYLTAQRISVNGTPLYILGDNGDESKLRWFVRIGGFDENKYLEQDRFTPTPRFWNTTLIGKLIPLIPYYSYYTSLQNGQPTHSLFRGYKPGAFAVYSEYLKYPENYTNNYQQPPLTLVYRSDSLDGNDEKTVSGVIIYKINHSHNLARQKNT